MARIIGKIESLKALRLKLNDKKIYRFNSISDINKFRKEFKHESEKVLKSSEIELLEEIKLKKNRIIDNNNKLKSKKKDLIYELDTKIYEYSKRHKLLDSKHTNFFNNLIIQFQIKRLIKKNEYLQNNYDNIILNKTQRIEKVIQKDSEDIDYLTNNKRDVIIERSRVGIDNLLYIRDTLNELHPLIAGAIGENLVVKEIKKLPDDFVLINDFVLEFDPPIYNKQNNDRIFSIQLDHLLISRAGIFILETKNWSEKSIKSFNLRSPVEQILRSSYALFVYINSIVDESYHLLDKHHWGEKKISIRNVIIMVNNKPKNEFKFVKIVTLNELNGYLNYFEPIFTKNEVKSISNLLIDSRE